MDEVAARVAGRGARRLALLALETVDDAVATHPDRVTLRIAARSPRRLAILARPWIEDAVAADGEAAPGLREAGVGDVGIRRRARGATRRRLARRGAAQDAVPRPLRSPDAADDHAGAAAARRAREAADLRSEEHTSELQSLA